ncbi:MAG: hypothetical protein FJW34_04560 [Acidobacteria bacterium]|nr:hypothetical protein [Acidobacteriota bacterium]
MNEGAIAVAVSLLALACQALNVWLSLRLRVGLLELEKRVLDQVEREFVRKEVCDERHDGHPARRRMYRLERVDPA